MIFRCRYAVAGGHVHCALFAAPRENQTFAKLGDICVRVEEFGPLRFAMSGFEFIENSKRQSSTSPNETSSAGG